MLEALSADLESAGELSLVVMDIHHGPGYKPNVTLRLERSGVRFNNSGRQPINLPDGTVLRAGPSGPTTGFREGLEYFGGIQRGVGLCLLDVLEPNGLLSRKVILHDVGRIRVEHGAGDPDALADETDAYRLRVEQYERRLGLQD